MSRHIDLRYGDCRADVYLAINGVIMVVYEIGGLIIDDDDDDNDDDVFWVNVVLPRNEIW